MDWQRAGLNDNDLNWTSSFSRMRRAVLETFQEAIVSQPIDAVVAYAVSPTVLRELTQRCPNIITFLINFDDIFHWPRPGSYTKNFYPVDCTSAVDLILTSNPDIVPRYLLYGGLAMFSPGAADPEIFRPFDAPFIYDVSFVGHAFAWRRWFIQHLRKEGVHVTTFGSGWENGPLPWSDLPRVFSQSRINLGFSATGQSLLIRQIKTRDFEVPMSGGLYLTLNNPYIHRVYDVGKEILVFDDPADCARKIRWLLAHPDEADKIRRAGHARARRDHTYEARFERAFSLAGLL
ncbi:MAG: glycosyltransferase [Dehalococcoidia bacterium]|nr:glycosyltransferase [Dehalococcoidia bacterium]